MYPKLPVPKPGSRDSESKLGPRKAKIDKFAVGIVALTLVGGIVIGWLLRPRLWTDPRIGESEEAAATATKSAEAEKARGDKLNTELETLAAAKKKQDKELEEAKKAESELGQRNAASEKLLSDTAAAQKKVAAAVGKFGATTAEGIEVRVRLADNIFKPNDDALTDYGKQILTKVAVALKELPDRHIAVQGHTDDQPIFVPPKTATPVPPATPKKPPVKPPAPAAPAPPPPKFATNWELSALRALAVVHYLQDVAKIDPKRLGALAYGQYRPVSTKQADNRRIEIVLFPAPEPKK